MDERECALPLPLLVPRALVDAAAAFLLGEEGVMLPGVGGVEPGETNELEVVKGPLLTNPSSDSEAEVESPEVVWPDSSSSCTMAGRSGIEPDLEGGCG